nr:coiled-coil domain-containing protein 27 isoform X3 [Zonotrichia albicollis]
MEADDSQEPELAETMGQLQQELRKAKDDHKMAIGAISSLQRQMEIQESELRKIRSEKELLQKQLREREVQLQAVSDKVRPKSVVAMASRRHSSWEFGIFATSLSHRQEGGEPVAVKLKSKIFSFQFCSLTEEQRQEEAVVAMVEENQNLQQFERYRNKIIQATFSVEGIQDPQGELTDDDVLEAMQKIFNERTEFQQMLKNKGSRTSLLSSDSSTASPARRRKSSRMEKL